MDITTNTDNEAFEEELAEIKNKLVEKKEAYLLELKECRTKSHNEGAERELEGLVNGLIEAIVVVRQHIEREV